MADQVPHRKAQAELVELLHVALPHARRAAAPGEVMIEEAAEDLGQIVARRRCQAPGSNLGVLRGAVDALGLAVVLMTFRALPGTAGEADDLVDVVVGVGRQLVDEPLAFPIREALAAGDPALGQLGARLRFDPAEQRGDESQDLQGELTSHCPSLENRPIPPSRCCRKSAGRVPASRGFADPARLSEIRPPRIPDRPGRRRPCLV